MGKQTSGYCFQDKKKRWFARITFTDSSGKRKNIQRKAESETAAKRLLKVLLRDFENQGEKTFQADQLNFIDLADYYSEKYIQPPTYANNRKITGMRSYKETNYNLQPLKEFFGKKKIKSITHADILNYKVLRLNTPIISRKKGNEKPTTLRPRSMAAVNRELALLRRILNIAHREGWINKHPFGVGETLISLADENKRDRILTRAEETNLLLAVSCKERQHIKPIIICALDTGMRKGEILSLKWKDVDLYEGLIKINAFNTKTLRAREVAISSRLQAELNKADSLSLKDPEGLVFGVSCIKRGFNTACKLANLNDLHFHDLRHTAATRLIQQGLPLQEVGRILGHTQANTTYRYVNANTDTARRAAQAMNDFHAQEQGKTEDKDDSEAIN